MDFLPSKMKTLTIFRSAGVVLLLLTVLLYISAFVQQHNRYESTHDALLVKPYSDQTIVDPYKEGLSVTPDQNAHKLVMPDAMHNIALNPEIYIYSAHYDPRVLPSSSNVSTIKLIGFGPMEDFEPTVRCIIRYGLLAETVSLKVYHRIHTQIPWKGQTLDSYIYTCDVAKQAIPQTISFMKSAHSIIKLPVHDTSFMPKHKYQFAVCVEPLTLRYNDADSLKHFITVNSFLGAEHFYFYNTSIGAQVDSLLIKLSILGLVTVFPWPIGSLQEKTHAYGQKAASAHCLLYNINVARYVALIDIDEVLVPRRDKTWGRMLEDIKSTKSAESAGAFVFKSQVFCLPDTSVESDKIPPNFHSLQEFQASPPLILHQWSKVLVDTNQIDVMDIHKVNRMLPGYTVHNVADELGLIHHYRRNSRNIARQEDKFMLRFQGLLLKKYGQLFQD